MSCNQSNVLDGVYLKIGRPHHVEADGQLLRDELYSRAVSFVDSFDFAALRGN